MKIIDAYKKSEKRDRQKILTRKNVIENRKEKLEIISKERVSMSCLSLFGVNGFAVAGYHHGILGVKRSLH